jgi:hypothetical protein
MGLSRNLFFISDLDSLIYRIIPAQQAFSPKSRYCYPCVDNNSVPQNQVENASEFARPVSTA